MSKYLVDEYPLIVLPTLAKVIGLNEAIFLQQLNYWLGSSRHEYDGRKWVYNTFEEWQNQLPFWPVVTIKRIVKKLRDSGVIITTSEYNKMPMDRTLWYSIDREKLDQIINNRPSYQNDTMPVECDAPLYQSDTMEVSERYDGKYQDDTSNNQILPDTTRESALTASPASSKPIEPPQAVANLDDPRIVLEDPAPTRQPGWSGNTTKPREVDEGTAAPGRLVKRGTGQDAYWILREYTSRTMTSHQMGTIRETVTDLKKWRKVCERWAEVYGDDWRKFGHLDWYRDGIPIQNGKQSGAESLGWKAAIDNQDVPDYIRQMQGAK